MTGRSPGRRPGSQDTRGQIVSAARAQFGARGYDATSMRAIAAEAGVDPALVHHYFGGKEQLFAACMQLPLDPSVELPDLLAGDQAEIGARLVRLQLRLWSEEGGRDSMMALVRSAASNEQAAAMMREFVTSVLLARLSPAVGTGEDAPLRAAGAASQLIGMAFARYVVKVPALAEASEEALVRTVGPAVQSYFLPA
jgi:AcrR family transcriptional regulator